MKRYATKSPLARQGVSPSLLAVLLFFISRVQPTQGFNIQTAEVLSIISPAHASAKRSLGKDIFGTRRYFADDDQQMTMRNLNEIGSIGSDQWNFFNIQKCSDLWHLCPQEEAKLMQLKENLQDINHPKNNPYEVVRFLKQYESIKSSEKYFRKMIKWRIFNDVDRLLEEYRPPTLYKYFPAATLKGFDKDGDPIHIERTGAADTVGLLQRYGKDEMLKFSAWIREVQSSPCQEWRKDYETSQGRPVKQFTLIFDMKGLSTKVIVPSVLSVGQEVVRIVQECYPYCAKRIIIVRTPGLFRIAWGIFKPFVDKSVRNLIHFSSEEDYQEVLAKYIDLIVLPAAIDPDHGQGAALDEFGGIVWEGGSIPSLPSATLKAKVKKDFLSTITSSSSPSSTLKSTATSDPTPASAQVRPRIISRNEESDSFQRHNRAPFLSKLRQRVIPSLIDWFLCKEDHHHTKSDNRKRLGQYTVYRPLV